MRNQISKIWKNEAPQVLPRVAIGRPAVVSSGSTAYGMGRVMYLNFKPTSKRVINQIHKGTRLFVASSRQRFVNKFLYVI